MQKWTQLKDRDDLQTLQFYSRDEYQAMVIRNFLILFHKKGNKNFVEPKYNYG